MGRGSLSADLMAISRGPFWQGPLSSSLLIESDRRSGREEELQAGGADRFSLRAKKFESQAAAAADISTVGTFSTHQRTKRHAKLLKHVLCLIIHHMYIYVYIYAHIHIYLYIHTYV